MNNYLKAILVHLFVALIFVIYLSQTCDLLDVANLLHYDAAHYFEIKTKGYAGVNIAFFPLFPLFWALTQATVFGICLLNGLLFYSSIFLLAYVFQFSDKAFSVALTLPGAVFFFLPYSESVFFFCSVLILIGFKKEMPVLVFGALVGSALARPAFTVFMPALFITYWFSMGFSRKYLSKTLWGSLALLIGMSLVGLIQYADTGAWFRFFAVQSEWGNHLQWPHLPFRSWGGDVSVRMDAMAFFCSGSVGIYLLYLLGQSKRSSMLGEDSMPLVFAFSYLGGILLLTFLFRGGSFFSLNRFVFSTAFASLALNHFYAPKNSISPSVTWKILVASLVVWLLFGAYVHLQTLLFFGMLSGYLWLFLRSQHPQTRWGDLAYYALLLINLGFQGFFFIRFLKNGWVG